MEFRSYVVRWCPPFFCTYVQYCSTDLLYMCRCAVNKTPGGPRAQEGTRTTGNSRELTHEHLKAVHLGAKNTHLLLRSKHIAPRPRIARAPELVVQKLVSTYMCRRLKTTKVQVVPGNKGGGIWPQPSLS